MKEDILEQLVDDYLQHKGYFTLHNIKFRPDATHSDYVRNKDSNHSDIDVLGINPTLTGPARIYAVSCKSWQSGLNPERKIEEIEKGLIVSGRDAWKGFRELVVPKWADAFKRSVFEMTNETEFTYVTAVTLIKGNKNTWEKHQPFLDLMDNNPVKLLTFTDIVDEIMPNIGTTVASSDIGRMLQLIKAAGWNK